MKSKSHTVLPLLGVLAGVLLILTFLNSSRLIVKGTIIGQTDDGAALLDIMPQKLFEIADVGDILIVSVEDFQKEMLLTDELNVEEGTYLLFYDSSNHCLCLCIYDQHFYKIHGLSGNEKITIRKKWNNTYIE